MTEDELKKTKQVAALSYTPGEDDVPKIVALGSGTVAEKILETAIEHDVPVVQDEKLAKTLNLLGVGDQIPPELYEIVAQVLIFVTQMDESYAKKLQYAKSSPEEGT